VRFNYEYHHNSRHWLRAYGNENWQFAADGLMERRTACIHEHPITEVERKSRWDLGRRPDRHPALSEIEL
jgi:nuclear transport factor 2 (NTF2) superfamily protein